MKKLIAALLVSLFMLAACQESSSIVAPDNDSSTDTEKFVPAAQDTSGSQDGNGRPGLPRV